MGRLLTTTNEAQITVAGLINKFGDKFTRREYQVLYDMYTTPRSNSELAAGLGVSVNTVKTHVRHIYIKLGVGGRMEFQHKLTARLNE